MNIWSGKVRFRCGKGDIVVEVATRGLVDTESSITALLLAIVTFCILLLLCV